MDNAGRLTTDDALGARDTGAALQDALARLRAPLITKTALLVCGGAYLAGAPFSWRTVGAVALAASAMWASLYALNETWDLTLEQGRRVRKGWVVALVALPAVIALLAVRLSPVLSALFVAMLAGQLLYSMPQVRGKRYWWFVILLSGMVNPALRLQCGAVFGSHPIPALGYVAVVALHVSGALRTRLLRRERDLRLGYVVVPEAVRVAGLAAAAIGLAALGVMSGTGLLPRNFILLLVLAAVFTAYAWSGKVTDAHSLRRGWVFCVPLAVLVPLLLWR